MLAPGPRFCSWGAILIIRGSPNGSHHVLGFLLLYLIAVHMAWYKLAHRGQSPTRIQALHTASAAAGGVEDLLQDHDHECDKECTNGSVNRDG